MTDRWRVALAGGVTAALALLFGAAVPFVPLLRADHALDQAVRAVALDWRDFGEERADERLRLELAQPPVTGRIGRDDCELLDGDTRVVRCAWRVVFRVPLVERRLHLDFGSEATVTPEGALR